MPEKENQPPYTLPNREPQNEDETNTSNSSTSASTSRDTHLVFVETVAENNTSWCPSQNTIAVHKCLSSGRYISYPYYLKHDLDYECQVAEIRDFTTCGDLIEQILSCIAYAEKQSTEKGWEKKFTKVILVRILWADGREENFPTELLGRGDSHARRVMGMVKQRGWKDWIRLKFAFTDT